MTVPTRDMFVFDDGEVYLDDMTREQAIEAVKILARQLESARDAGFQLCDLFKDRTRKRWEGA